VRLTFSSSPKTCFMSSPKPSKTLPSLRYLNGGVEHHAVRRPPSLRGAIHTTHSDSCLCGIVQACALAWAIRYSLSQGDTSEDLPPLDATLILERDKISESAIGRIDEDTLSRNPTMAAVA